MKLLRNIIIAVLSIVAVVSLVVEFGPRFTSDSKPLGSVNLSNEYHSTTTPGIGAYAVIQSGPGSLGSVVVLGANTGTCALYDATSTVTNSQWATTTLAAIPASLAAGDYVFDVIFQKGLLIDCKGTQPTTTITFR